MKQNFPGGGWLGLALVLTLLGVPELIAFEPRARVERWRAVGNLEELTPALRKLFLPNELFAPMNRPGPIDWLAVHDEPGQTFDEYVSSRANKPIPPRDKIFILPLGRFETDHSPSLEKLAEFTRAFFQLKVVVLPAVPITNQFKTRTNAQLHRLQILSTDVLSWLRPRLPAEGFCILGVTMTDLYPEESWNYVFGQASLSGRVGVFSFARYDPVFFDQPRDTNYHTLILQRSASVLAHETGHMFGLHHCIYFQCLMNGSNHLRESDSRPMHLCPVCLRKLYIGTRFDPVRRYEELLGFMKYNQWLSEASWTEEMLKRVRP